MTGWGTAGTPGPTGPSRVLGPLPPEHRGPLSGRPWAVWPAAFALGLLLLAVERAVLVVLFHRDEPGTEVLGSFLHGLRFDAAGLAYPLAFAFLVCTVLGFLRGTDGGAARGATAALAFVALAAAAEVPFFREFRVRLDFVALEYLDDPFEALSLAFATVGWIGAAAVLGAAALASWVAVRWIGAIGASAATETAEPPRVVPSLAIATLLFVAARGGFGRPIRPQDACRSEHPFVNQLDLSGPFTLLRHAYEAAMDDGAGALDLGIPADQADAVVAEEPYEGHPMPGMHPRRFVLDEQEGRRSLVGANVVIVLLESFSARHVGVCGAKGADAWTPRFDELVNERDGFLFTNFWAAGPSSNRAVPAVFASFPSLPSRLAVTKSAAGQQNFRALPRILGELGYDSCFVSGGAEGWENLGGWLRQQGFARIVGRAAFPQPWRSARWGPPDAVLLDRVLAECDARAEEGKFLVAALTTTNHPPFPIPDDDSMRFPPGATDRERAMRYADAAIGRFMDAALARPWAKNTVFLLLGDHGFHEDPQAEIDPDRYRVPCAVFVPKERWVNPMRGTTKLMTDRWPLPASQVDVLPMVLRYVATNGTRYAAWGAVPRLTKPGEDRIVVLGPHGGEPVVAALDARGNYLVERLDGGPSRLYRLVGGDVDILRPAPDHAALDDPDAEPPWPNGRLVPHDDPEAEARLRRYIRAYLTSAQRVLVARKASGE